MNPGPRRSLVVGLPPLLLIALVGGACDLLIGIQELSTPPDEEEPTCETPADCPGTGNPCYVRACTSDRQCEVREVEPGLVVQEQIPGDCHRTVCTTGGETEDEVDASDVAEDGSPCTIDACDAEGSPTSTLAPAGTPCGDAVCDARGECVQCVGPEQCAESQECVDSVCIGAGCDDGVLNGEETDVDCGGADCATCADGSLCDESSDCDSGVCEGSGGDDEKCQAPKCNDEVHNGDETDADCGGSCATGCSLTEGCVVNDDCAQKYCDCSQVPCACAVPTCMDGLQNGNEIDIDCGPGLACRGKCQDGRTCAENNWCQSGVCNPDSDVCAAPSCQDGVHNGLEEGIDCDDPNTPIIDSGCEDCLPTK